MLVLGIVILAIVLAVAIFGIVKVSRDSYSDLPVACAGSIDGNYPANVRVKLPNDFNPKDKHIGNSDSQDLRSFIVKGNSMQYANINPNDIIFVSPLDADSITNLPIITLLSFKPKNRGMASYKIRRTWKLVDADISIYDFDSVMDEILSSKEFLKLSDEMGRRCPENHQLKAIARRRFSEFKASSGFNPQDRFLISTTFRTERDRLEFSIHSVNSIEGEVTMVSHIQHHIA